MKIRMVVGVACLSLFCIAQAHAGGAGLTVKAGTLGIGVDGTVSVAPMVNVRGNVNFFKYSFDGTQSGVKYNVDLKLRSFAVLLDLHPAPRVGFRLSAGLLFNKNRIDMVSDQLTGTYSIGAKTYTIGQVGALNGGGKFRTTVPYLGIGWGNAAGRRVGVAFDLGVGFQGLPDVSLRATGPIANDPTFLAEMNQEVRDVENDLPKILKYYPVLSLGLTFKLL